MQSNFFKTLSSLGYTLLEDKDKDKDKSNSLASARYIFNKRNVYSAYTIIFNIEQKYIRFLLTPIRTLECEDDVTRLYADYKKLVEDVRYLENLSKYRIINDIEKDLE